jgi:hypothetical protein
MFPAAAAEVFIHPYCQGAVKDDILCEAIDMKLNTILQRSAGKTALAGSFHRLQVSMPIQTGRSGLQESAKKKEQNNQKLDGDLILFMSAQSRIPDFHTASP